MRWTWSPCERWTVGSEVSRLVRTWIAGQLGKEGIYVYILINAAESLRYSPETTTTLLTGYTPVKNKEFKVYLKKET